MKKLDIFKDLQKTVAKGESYHFNYISLINIVYKINSSYYS